MKLPNADLAKVERKKITEYLLNDEHPDNGVDIGETVPRLVTAYPHEEDE
jgi:hypothetical protein